MVAEHINWDNLRVFLAVVRAQSAQEAARRLAVDHSTITRRLHRLEKELGSQLFDRTPAGHVLTTAGHRLLAHAQVIENTLEQVGQDVAGDRHAVTGTVRLGATDGFGSFFLAPQLAHFSDRHPGIQIELLTLPRFVNLSQREADLAINVERPQGSGQVCSKLTDYRLRLYGSRTYLACHAPIRHPRDLSAHRFFGYVEDLTFSDALRYLPSVAPDAATPLRSTSIVAQYNAVRQDQGLAVLPCFLAAHSPELVPVLPQDIDLVRTFWAAAPADRRDLARVRAVWDYLREVVAAHQPLLLGTPPEALDAR